MGLEEKAVDADRNVVLWSEGAERLLGFSAEEAVGSHCLKSHRCAECMAGCGIERLGNVTDVGLTLFRVHALDIGWASPSALSSPSSPPNAG